MRARMARITPSANGAQMATRRRSTTSTIARHFASTTAGRTSTTRVPSSSRWYNYARNINNLVGIFGDKEWGALQPGSKGWILGFKYVPAKNIEWETFYEMATAQNTLYGHKNETYHRNFVRTMVDYHF